MAFLRARWAASVAMTRLGLALSSASAAAPLVSCPPSGGNTGDLITRGFYIQNYPGPSLGTVQLLDVGSNGSYTVTLTARLGAFDGPLVGTPQTVSFTMAGATSVTFNFGNVPVPNGSTITFAQTMVAGPGTLFFDVGPCSFGPCASCPGVVETEDFAPPLSTARRGSVAVTINAGSGAPTAGSVPTLSPWALALFGLGLAAIAILALRK
jgi:hypothetical protein